MSSLLRMAVLGAIVTLSVGAMVLPVMSREQLCLRFNNSWLVSSGMEGQEALHRMTALGMTVLP